MPTADLPPDLAATPPVPSGLPRALVQSPRLPEHLAELQRLLRDESARREAFLDWVQPHHKAEFINGEVLVHSPARANHVVVTSRLVMLLGTYAQRHRLGIVLAEKAMISLSRNDYEPDVSFFQREKAAAIAPDAVRLPAPDLVVEILSPSTEKRDRGIKFDDYAAHGIAEYWIVDAEAEVLEQYVRGDDGTYALRMKSGSGTVTSVAMDGFVAPVRALFDDAANDAALAALYGAA